MLASIRFFNILLHFVNVRISFCLGVGGGVFVIVGFWLRKAKERNALSCLFVFTICNLIPFHTQSKNKMSKHNIFFLPKLTK